MRVGVEVGVFRGTTLRCHPPNTQRQPLPLDNASPSHPLHRLLHLRHCTQSYDSQQVDSQIGS